MDQAKKTKSITIVVDAFSTNEYEDAPAYAAFDVNQEFLARIEAVRSVVERLDLAHAGLNAYPEQWGPGEIEESLRLTGCELILDRSGYCYFEAQPKWGQVIQCRGFDLRELEEAYADGNDGDIVYLGDQAEVKEMYLEDIGASEAPELEEMNPEEIRASA